MKLEKQAILSRTTTDVLKSKQLNPELVQLVLDVYMTPKEWAEIIEKLYSKEFKIVIKDE